MKPGRRITPDSPDDDETSIAAGRKDVVAMLLVILPFGVAWFADAKWVMAAGFAAVIFLLNDADARLYDLCMRIRRINRLIREQRGRSEKQD